MSDPRFARLKSDPRFRRPRKQKSKVVLDERFQSVLDSGKSTGSKKRVDKYGRPLSKTQEQENLKRFYRLETQDQDEAEQAPKITDYARGEVLLESSDEDEDGQPGDGDSSDDDGAYVSIGRDHMAVTNDEEAEIDLDEGDIAALDAQAVAYQKSHPDATVHEADQTRRLAIVNLDWDHVRATHLFKICSSLVSPSAPALASSSSRKRQRDSSSRGPSTQVVRGRVLSVRIYPSEFGKERMAREEKEGPPTEIFKKRKDDENVEVDERNIYELGDEDEHDDDALRKYQLERLRYFYAIVTCDTVDAAAHIYEELEGTELERSANIFDLSFVPEDMSFEDEWRDEATEDASVGFKAVEFVTDALRHSKVKLTWDEDDPERNQITRKTLTQKEIDEADFRTYLASSSSGSESEAEEKGKKKATSRDKLRSLLLGPSQELPEGWGGDDEEKDVDMEVTFSAGLTESKDEETTLDKYQRKMREKRKKRKDELKETVPRKDVTSVGNGDDDFFDVSDDEEVKKGKKVNKKVADRPISTPGELSLLISPDNPDKEPKHFDMKAVLKAEKKAKLKGKRKMKTAFNEDEAQEDFSIDPTDDRFKALHEDHNFAIDPSNPHFKKTKGMSVLLEERARRQKQMSGRSANEVLTKDSLPKERSLKSLVDSVKGRSIDTSGSGKRRKLG